MICRGCGKDIIMLSDYGQPHECRKCYNARMKEYNAARRWLNGGERKDDMGDAADIFTTAINGSARVYSVSRGRLA